MSIQDYVTFEAQCPVCGETLTDWQSFNGPGECEVYTVSELMTASNKKRVIIQCDHKCQGHWRRATVEFEVVSAPQMVGKIEVIE